MAIINKKPNLKELKAQGYTCVDMHVHTKASKDAFADIKKLLKKAGRQGFGLAITDHNEIVSAVYAYETQKEVLVIPGIEVKTYAGIDLLIYFYLVEDLKKFFKEDIAPYQKHNSFINSQKVEQVINKAVKYRCVIASPHPFIMQDLGIGTAIEKGIVKEDMLHKIDLVEVINGTSHGRYNLDSQNWAKENNIKICGGSDSHHTIPCGSVLTCLKLKRNENFLDKIKKEEALVIGKQRNFLGVIFGFLMGHVRLLSFPNGLHMVKEHLGVCFTMDRRKAKK